jgi:hypothetical protein
MVRGIYSTENLYDFVTLPPEMRFKFSFHISKWPEQFAWLEMPTDMNLHASEGDLAVQRFEQVNAKAKLVQNNANKTLNDRQRDEMERDISNLLDAKRQAYFKPQPAEEKPRSNRRQF